MMKKIFKILGVIVVLFMAAIVVLPIVFKDSIVEKLKEEINKNVNAKVDFGDFDLSLISSFPDFSFGIENISVEGLDEFEGIKMADIGEINLVVDVMSVINGESIRVKVIEIVSPQLHVLVNKDGKANYDIAKSTEVDEEVEVEEEVEVTETTESSSFELELDRFEISEAQIIYDDKAGNMFAQIKDFNFLLNGDFSEAQTGIESDISIAALTYKMDGVSYLNKAEISIHAELDADLENEKYAFTENSFRINQLVLGLDGWVQMGDNDEMDMDLTFNTKETTFKSLLSMIPAVYARDFADVQTNGKLALSGFAKGKMVGESFPAFGLDLSVKDANFKYPDLPKSVDNIQIAVNIASGGGDLDNMTIDVSKFHFELAANPFDIELLVKTPMSDPYLKVGFNGTIDLGSLKDVIPLEEGDEMNGLIAMNVNMEGNQSTLDEERYEDFAATGNLAITAMDYKSKELPYDVAISSINVDFAPKYITLNEMNMKVGKSDFQIVGQVERFIPYVFDENAILYARVDMNSTLIDATEFMDEEETEASEAGVETSENEEGSEAQSTSEEPMEVVEIPGNLDVVFNCNISKIHMADYDIDNFKGEVTMKEQKMSLRNTALDLLDGHIDMDGSYETTKSDRPSFDFNIDMQKFDVQKTVTTFNTVEKMVPVFKKADGGYSAKFNVKGVFDEKMEVIGESLYGGGAIFTHKVQLKDFAAMEMLADKLKKEELRDPRLDDLKLSFTLEAGKMYMDPFDIKAGNIITTLSGWTAFDQTMEYSANIAIPSEDFGGAANQAAASLLSVLQEKTGQSIDLPEIVNLTAKITGNVDDPKIALDLPNMGGGSAKEDMKKKLAEELEKKKKELEAKARAEAERLKNEAKDKAKAEADKLKKQAEAEAKKKVQEEKRKAEAAAKKKLEEEKRKQEAAAKKKAEEEAKKKLKGLFK